MRKIAIAMLFVCVTTARPASAASGPFDGQWVGTAPEAGDCGVLTVSVAVRDNMLTGTVSGKKGSPPIVTTSVGSDGTAKVRYARFEGSVDLSGARFTGTFDTFCGLRSVTGKKSG
jgi:hypothetical protein